MKLEHNSRDLLYRTPFGAVTAKSRISLRLSVADGGILDEVNLIVIYGAEKRTVPMYYCNMFCGICIYEAVIEAPETVGLLWYYFEVKTFSGAVYYGNDRRNLGGLGEMYYNEPEYSFQITVYDENFKTPDWFKETVVYQIFPDRFYNGNENGEFFGGRTDIIKRSWDDIPFYKAEQFGGEYLSNDFFGGNLSGIIKKLPYLADLGIGAIYLNPIFKAFSNHKYDTGDYMQIDEMFGDDETFRSLCIEAEKYGIRIILDGVFNHTGSDSRYFNKNGTYDSVGAYQSEDSPYYEWYKFIQYPDVYESWWGMSTLPHVDESSERYQNFILKSDDAVVKHWIREGAYGWRLDVVDELPGFFVKELRKQVKSENPDAVIIGEVWEDASNKVSYGERREYFLGSELDSVMNYPFRNMLIDFALNRIDAQSFDERFMSLMENYPEEAFYSLLNVVSTHDVARILTVLGNVPDEHSVPKNYQAVFSLAPDIRAEAKNKLKALCAVQILMPGVPCIFYGDEAGMEGYRDPFCRGTFPWGREDRTLTEWYKKIIKIRNTFDIYKKGRYETVYKIGYSFAFMRRLGSRAGIVIACFNRYDETVRIDLARFGIFEMTDSDGETVNAEKGIFYINMRANSARFFECTISG